MKSLSVFSFLIFFIISPFVIKAQDKDPKPPSTGEEFEKKYQQNIKKERLHGVYIPKDLVDAFVQLNILIDKGSQSKFKNMEESAAVKKLHFSFGRWITHNWSLYPGSRYSHYVKSIGIHHPEEMASFTILMYHRYLNKKKLDVKGYMEDFKKKREEAKKEKLKKGKVLETFKRKRKN
ncbi:MAG: hypothetical protein P8M17_00790 [Saprospiraceae bacterium]|jgi:hypothetical protein|nr:hypothetical protein [Saprospiraceae bacterium]MDG2417495.1 hypothetical protein [Saprospiraceae bacterium]